MRAIVACVLVGLVLMRSGAGAEPDDSSAEVQWTTYRNTVFGYEIQCPSFFVITEGFKGVWWKPEHGRRDILRRGLQVNFGLAGGPGITIATRECEGLPECSEITGRGRMEERVIGGETFCRAGYVDHAMGGRWAVNIEYIVLHDAVCYHIMYTGLQGAEVTAAGTVSAPQSEKDVDTETDPEVFARMLSTFRLIKRAKP